VVVVFPVFFCITTRDRRKDRVLQEDGYLLLRSLAEDVGKELDMVLDAIQRALSNRQSVAPLTFARRSRT
jgi:very-short-patch-repair endonuclease